ncbi:hypothetical protein QJS10_CPA07g01233 [Acorus calamus]|uniref:Uncharacterized protein n=1 Tax=Acorus calamus TaxID=4465 RepID=A0AAV9EE05_ACOCL|nr:hypothetical protein QJS10_CPA07g01233 [Acorus calamus]
MSYSDVIGASFGRLGSTALHLCVILTYIGSALIITGGPRAAAPLSSERSRYQELVSERFEYQQ